MPKHFKYRKKKKKSINAVGLWLVTLKVYERNITKAASPASCSRTPGQQPNVATPCTRALTLVQIHTRYNSPSLKQSPGLPREQKALSVLISAPEEPGAVALRGGALALLPPWDHEEPEDSKTHTVYGAPHTRLLHSHWAASPTAEDSAISLQRPKYSKWVPGNPRYRQYLK